VALKLALPRESNEIEKRVALDPTTVARLTDQHNVDVVIQSHCGDGAGFYDDDYENAQVTKTFAECVKDAIVVVKVKPPTVEEAQHLPIGSVLLSNPVFTSG